MNKLVDLLDLLNLLNLLDLLNVFNGWNFTWINTIVRQNVVAHALKALIFGKFSLLVLLEDQTLDKKNTL